MVKIWEVDFTNFIGATDQLYDQVSTNNLTTVVGNMNKQTHLVGFTNRQGIYIASNSAVSNYTLYTSSGPNITQARFIGSYTNRSYVLWIRPVGLGNSSFWNASSRNTIWTSYYSTTIGAYGIGCRASKIGVYNSSASSAVVDTSTYLQSDKWQLIVVTIAKGSSRIELFLDGVSMGSVTSLMPNTGTITNEIIGDATTASEGSYYLGYAATYDHILTQGEITAIYNTFLVDSVAGGNYYQTFSGYVYGLNNTPASGVDLRAFHLEANNIVHTTTSSGDGYFNMILPYSGVYVVTAEDAPYGGTRTIPVIAASGGVYFP